MKCNLCQNSIYTKHYCNSDLLCAKHDSTLSSSVINTFQLQFLLDERDSNSNSISNSNYEIFSTPHQLIMIGTEIENWFR